MHYNYTLLKFTIIFQESKSKGKSVKVYPLKHYLRQVTIGNVTILKSMCIS